jgi:hypothetical protein
MGQSPKSQEKNGEIEVIIVAFSYKPSPFPVTQP